MAQLAHSRKKSVLPSSNALIPSSKRSHEAAGSARNRKSSKKILKYDQEVRRNSPNSACSAKNNQPAIATRASAKANSSCSFCRSNESGGNVRNCKRRKALQQVAVEHDAYSTEHRFDCLLRTFEHGTSLNVSSATENLMTSISSDKVKHAHIYHA